ncbi:acyltransferase-domain-containing protein [Tribonema minus]|uniref:Acyltransferase-domain-containing protein n=1 Tax=Tribonema minus TaxID=303371 RepID=A0A835ZF56_9STRA|nr:acyltransferase-domain-containing protein [Tribonema minus]
MLLITCWVVYLVSPKLKRKLNSQYAQLLFVRGISYVLPPVEMVVTGDEFCDGSQAIVIANHQVDADWWYPWCLLRAYGQDAYAKFILKADLGRMPLVGWGLKGLDFIMLRRDWQVDQKHLMQQLQVFVHDDTPLRLVIFPEGTTMNTTSLEKSTAFAQKQGRPELKRLLLPRTTGFAACLDCLKDVPSGTVYDLTIAYEGYSGEVPTWEMGYERARDVTLPSMAKLMAAQRCGRAHIHVAAHEMSAVAAAGGAEAWLDAAWARKDALLETFIKERRFPGEARVVRVSQDARVFFTAALALPAAFVWAAVKVGGACAHALAVAQFGKRDA